MGLTKPDRRPPGARRQRPSKNALPQGPPTTEDFRLTNLGLHDSKRESKHKNRNAPPSAPPRSMMGSSPSPIPARRAPGL